jgi:hypothetical protein
VIGSLKRFRCLGLAKPTLSVFNNLMATANEIARLNPLGLPDLVKAILRPLQSEHMYLVAERDDHKAPPAIDPLHFFMPHQPWRLSWIYGNDTFAEGDPVNPENFRVRLSSDLVLPTCWNRARFEGVLAAIGSRKVNPNDLPWNFHPAESRASGEVTPCGAV